MGDMTRVMSRSRTNRHFGNIVDLEDAEKYPAGSKVWLRGRLQSIRVKGGSCFLVLRQGSFNTAQALFFTDKEDPEGSEKTTKYLKTLIVETVVDLKCTVVGDADTKSCWNIERLYAVSKARAQLP